MSVVYGGTSDGISGAMLNGYSPTFTGGFGLQGNSFTGNPWSQQLIPQQQPSTAEERAYYYDKIRAVLSPTTSPTNPMAYAGNRFLVVCNGNITEMPYEATIEQAQERAEALTHQFSVEAFILKPVRKVAPKRDVVTTDL